MLSIDLSFSSGLLISAVIGACLGSFATALIYRVPRDIPWIRERKSKGQKPVRSACPECSHTLSILDLIPVLSWVLNAGRCRYCKTSIAARYIIIETSAAMLCVLTYLVLGLGPFSLLVFFLVPFLLALLVIDLDYMLLPNQLVAIVAALGVMQFMVRIYYAFSEDFKIIVFEYVGGAFLYAISSYLIATIMTRILKKDAMGFGDVKFFGAAGLWLGASMFPMYLIISGLSGVLFGIIWKTLKAGEAFPFGPALIFTLYFLLLFPQYGTL